MGRERSERILWGRGAAEADSEAAREDGMRSERTQASDVRRDAKHTEQGPAKMGSEANFCGKRKNEV